MFRGDRIVETKPSGYKNVNSSSIKIINQKDLKTTPDNKVEHRQGNTNALYEFISQVRKSIIPSS